MLAACLLLALGFGVLNGVHDAGNVTAAAIATRALPAGRALGLAAAFHVLGGVLGGTAVAATVASVVRDPAALRLPVLLVAILVAGLWSAATLLAGLPCSSGHCLVGALAGAALGWSGAASVQWGGLSGLHPTGVIGSLVWLAASSLVVLPAAALGIRAAVHLLRRARRSVVQPVRRVEVGTAAALAFAHGANDSQKTMGLLGLALVAGGTRASFAVPWWAVAGAVAAVTGGTCLGGWRVVRTLGRGIIRLTALDGAVAQTVAASTVLLATAVGGPVSTTDVVAPALVGVGLGMRRHHVHWTVARRIALAWLITLPVTAALGAALASGLRAAGAR